MKTAISIITLSFFILLVACSSSETAQLPLQPAAEAQVAAGAANGSASQLAENPELTAPIVLRTIPERGVEQPLDAPLEIKFDQPMDRDSVEKAFAIEPGASVDGEFEWVDEQTVRFALRDGFVRGQRYRIRVVESAQSQAGLEMARPFELRFSAAGFLEVTNVQPGPGATEILPATVVTILFNRPVVPLNAIEAAASLPDPVTFVPPVRGEGEWLNTSIYQFTPANGGFAPATDYTARVSQGLTDASGTATLERDFEWAFSTVMPAVVATFPAAGDLYVSPTPVIKLAFNQPMARADVEQNFRLVNEATSEIIPGEFSWTEGGLEQPRGDDDSAGFYGYAYAEGEGPVEVGLETVTFVPNLTLDFDSVYRAELPRGTRSDVGQAETQRDFSFDFTVTPYPRVLSTFPESGSEFIDPWQSLQITFNAPMSPESVVVGKNLLIEPTVSVTRVFTYWWSSDTNLELSFPTEASSQYEVTLGPTIEGRYGQRLGAPTNVAWTTRAQNPTLFMHSPGRVAHYGAFTDTLAFITARNLGQINFRLYRLPGEDFMILNGDNWWEAWDRYNRSGEQPLSTWSKTVDPPLNESRVYRVDLGAESGLGDRLPPGLYYLEVAAASDDIYDEAASPDGQYDLFPDRKMLVVSNHNLTLKVSNHEALAWLTDLQRGQPVSDVPLTFVAGGESQQANTDAGGVSVVDYQQIPDTVWSHFAFAGDPDSPDENFAVAVSTWTDGIDRYQFDNVATEDYQQPFNAHFYTDRKIYRPGQMVHFKGIIRADDDANYSLPSGYESASVTIRDSQGKEILRDELPLSPMGTVNGSFELDENAALGFYSIEVLLGTDNYFYGDFQVAAYRKPEFVVSVETDRPEYVHDDKIRVSAAAEFFFGGPVSKADVRWTLVSNDFSFPFAGSGFYDFTDYDTSRGTEFFTTFGETLAEGQGSTDNEGRFTFEVEADIADKISSQRFTLDVVVTDLNNQEVASQAEAVVHKGLFYVGLRPVRYVSTAGQETPVEVLVVDWDSEPVSGQDVQVVLAEHNWYSVQKQYEDGAFYWDSVAETVPVFTTTVTTDRNGEAIATFTPEQGGIYRLLASAEDRRSNQVRSSTFMWVSGSEFVNWRQENNDRLELVTDKRTYNVGDTATILVPHPYSGTVQALVTLERGHIYDYFVTELETNSEQLQIPITEDMIPNMFVSVVVVQGSAPGPIPAAGGDQSSLTLPSFKVGYASLPINTGDKELQIRLTPDKSAEEDYRPGETAEYFVNVANSQGEPVKAELSLALVDKAVLTLAPEQPGRLLETFWRNRGLGVRTGAGLTLAIDRINLTVADEAKGGGGGFDEGFGVIRGDFKDTALWVADFVTDEAGGGIVEATLPDNLTTWTMTAKGVTGADTLVGESRVEIVSTKPLLVRPVTPRFFVVDDRAQLGVIVQNNSNDTLDVVTRFEADGLEIGDWRQSEPAGGGPLGEWQQSGAPELTIEPGERVKIEYDVTVENVQDASLTMGAKSAEYGDALTFDLPVYRFSTPETVATVGILEEDGLRTESIVLPSSYDPTQGDLTVHIDPSLAAGMRDGLAYLEHFRYECTEQTVSRFLPNVFTYRAYQQLKLENPELEARLPGLVSTGLQRLYNQQHFDGGWGWFIRDDSDPFLTAYVLLGLVEARRAGFSADEEVISAAVDYLAASLVAPKDVAAPWQANRQAFMLYVLAEAGQGDLGRSLALFNEREKLDIFGRAYLAMAIHLLDDEAGQIETLVDDITGQAIVSATGAHWEEAQVDYYAMNTDTRSTAIIIAALSRIRPDHPLLPNAVRWLMSIRENGGHWETTQETAWAIIGLTDWMTTTGELEGNYRWNVTLNGQDWGEGQVDETNIDQTTKLYVEVGTLLADAVNRLAIERNPVGDAVEGSPGQLHYAAYLTYYKPVPEVKALDRGIVVSRKYSLADDAESKAIAEAEVGDVVQVDLTIIAPNDLHYVLVEDPFPAGAEGIDTSLATTSIVGQEPELTRTDQPNPWSGGYGWWYFSHSEIRDEKAVLFATFLPKGTYEYSYQIRASLPGEYRVIPTHAEQMYFPEVFGRGDGGLFRITQ